MSELSTAHLKKRPAVVTILTWLFLIAALVDILIGATGLFALTLPEADLRLEFLLDENVPEQLFADTSEQLVLSGWLLIVGIVQFVIAIGFWRQRTWAWVAMVSWQALSLLVEITLAFVGTIEPLPLFVPVVLILLLNQSDVRRIFGITRQKNESTPIKPLNSFDSN